MSQAPNLGTIITNPRARQIVYVVYAVAALVVGGLQVWYASTEAGQPSWLTGALAVIAYLGIGIGGLATANATVEPGTPEVVHNITYEAKHD